jgi:hypothetical protein
MIAQPYPGKTLASLHVQLLEDIYERVEFDPEDDELPREIPPE